MLRVTGFELRVSVGVGCEECYGLRVTSYELVWELSVGVKDVSGYVLGVGVMYSAGNSET